MSATIALSATLTVLGAVFTASATPYSFTTITDPSATGRTDPFDINNLGQIVGGFGDNSGPHGFIDSGGTFSTIDFPGAPGTVAHGINDSGQIVGEYFVNVVNLGQVTHGFLDSGGNFTTIDFPGALQTSAFGINSSGQIVGYYVGFNSAQQAIQQFGFIYSGGIFTTIADPDIGPPTGGTHPQGINDAGQIVGSFDDGDQTVASSTPGEFSQPSTCPAASKPWRVASTTLGTFWGSSSTQIVIPTGF